LKQTTHRKVLQNVVAIYLLCQIAAQINLDVIMVSVFRGQSSVTSEWTVSIDLMNVNVVSRTR